ncbi:hypothetical protein EJ04DRAFT_553012 [Polyplosphaeria fusca]|uniref:DUF7708 domain-containing protein n=1 Tax=Polyplosphaeria fusca TaxID=682080 RepID=A0A9P4QU61_9PLEO|nr:hypothetical protein EJ04DRAFT_553012 [Polyplosphaeria fusca]
MAHTTESRANTIPRPSEQPPEVDYLQNRQDDYQSPFDVGRQEFIPQPVRTRTVSWDLAPPREDQQQLVATTESFARAVERLKKKKGKESDVAKFNFKDVQNWTDVNQIVRDEEKKYYQDDTVSGKVRKFFRKVGDNGKSIQSFVGLLPDGNYKTLCGGLTLILTGMATHSEIREKMTELMNELPDDIEDSEDYARMYGGSKLLRQRVEDLYVDILSALEYIVKWYTQGTARHVRDSLLKNQNYSQLVDIKIRDIQASRMRFEKATRKFLHKRMQIVSATVLDTHGVVQSSHDGLVRIEGSLEDAKKGAQETTQSLIRRMSGLESQVMNGFQRVLADHTRNAKWQKEVDVLREDKRKLLEEKRDTEKLIAELKSRVNQTSYMPKDLAKLLELDLPSDGHRDDVESVHTTGLNETLEFQQRARWIAEHERFQQFLNWLSSDESSLLLAQGNTERAPLSPMSFLTSLLFQKLEEGRNVLVLPFFCGIHRGSRFHDSDELSGPLIWARALLAQMLSLKKIDWSEGNDGLAYLSLTPGEAKKLANGSFSTYLKLICNLLTIFKRRFNAIFVLIDGLDWYDLTWEKEIKRMVRSFLRLVEGDDVTGTVGVLKVFLTTGSHANEWPKPNDNATVIDMPDEIDGEGDSFDILESIDSD